LREAFQVVLAAIVLVGFLLAGFYLKRRRPSSTETAQLTERTIRSRVRQASQNGDTAELAKWLYIWRDRVRPVKTLLLREHARQIGDLEFVRQVDGVLEGAFASHPEPGPHVITLPGGRRKGLIDRFRDLMPTEVRIQLNP
jgi:hypothetical protein